MVPTGGLVRLSGDPAVYGTQFTVPVNMASATPAAMKSDIPLPMPHFETTSSIRNTR